jgi:hypothetical protein
MDTNTPILDAPAPANSDTPLVPDSPSTDALTAAFAQFAEGMTDTMRTPEAAESAPAEQPRDEQGRFLPQDAPAPEEPAPVDTQQPPAPAEASTEVGAEPGDEDIDPALVVDILPRHAHEQPYKIAVDSPEIAERLRQNLNGAMRREQFEEAMREVEARAEQVEQQEVQLMVDPVRAVRETLTPEQQDLLILALLTDDTVFQRVGPQLETLQDDLSRRELRLDVRDKYTQAREQATGQIEQQRAVQRNTREVKTALEAIMPESLAPAAQQLWMKDAMRELSVVCRQHNIRLLDPMAIPTALQARLVATGVDPASAAENIARALYGRRGGAAATPPNGGAPRAASAPALPAPPRAGTPTPGQRPVQALKVAHERRAAAAATAGPGMGTPASGGLPSLPAGAGLDEALALVRRVKQ